MVNSEGFPTCTDTCKIRSMFYVLNLILNTIRKAEIMILDSENWMVGVTILVHVPNILTITHS